MLLRHFNKYSAPSCHGTSTNWNNYNQYLKYKFMY